MRLFGNVIRQMERKYVVALGAFALTLVATFGLTFLPVDGTGFVAIFAICFLAAFPLTWASAIMMILKPRSRKEITIAKTTLVCSIIGLILMFAWRPTDLSAILVLPLTLGSIGVMSGIGIRQYINVRRRFIPSRYR